MSSQGRRCLIVGVVLDLRENYFMMWITGMSGLIFQEECLTLRKEISPGSLLCWGIYQI